MEPQNVSFIEAVSADDEENTASKTTPASASKNSSSAAKNLSDRLSRLNITSGSKTYRVLSDDKDSSPSPTRGMSVSGPSPPQRPTISAAFKQSRKGSGGEGGGGTTSPSGPPSLRSNSGRLGKCIISYFLSSLTRMIPKNQNDRVDLNIQSLLI